MILLISSFFVFFLLIVGIFALFIVYHLRQYNTHSGFANLQITIFLFVLGFLIIMSILSFAGLPLDEFLGNGNASDISFP
ncbi:MAG: hypothetical protein IPN70_02770 [Candidatus Moraniibacteriota bacterium]|nr:MAG: hypothetical protein IPN70_02770 [Candidatus Moranbacteria bacterium]